MNFFNELGFFFHFVLTSLTLLFLFAFLFSVLFFPCLHLMIDLLFFQFPVGHFIRINLRSGINVVVKFVVLTHMSF